MYQCVMQLGTTDIQIFLDLINFNKIYVGIIMYYIYTLPDLYLVNFTVNNSPDSLDISK